MNLVYLAIGIGMLVFGRKLFWLFTGGIGFFLGYTLAPKILSNQSENVILVIAVIMGLLGIFLAILIKTAAISIAGFAAGAYIVYSLLPMINFDLGNYYWLVVIVGGVLGAILAGTMFDWALIILTAASGAVLVSQTLDLTYPLSAVVLVVLFLIGLIVQGNMKSKD
ncbi:MAG: hypothetical protein C4545_01920 [Anaerolineaceae bacterium]|jgi:hypothetical protein|nr:MAG: hypothetical protein C4545_01920 [Anaerolineaceae bacterium]